MKGRTGVCVEVRGVEVDLRVLFFADGGIGGSDEWTCWGGVGVEPVLLFESMQWRDGKCCGCGRCVG